MIVKSSNSNQLTFKDVEEQQWFVSADDEGCPCPTAYMKLRVGKTLYVLDDDWCFYSGKDTGWEDGDKVIVCDPQPNLVQEK